MTADVLGSSPAMGSTPTSVSDPSKKLGRVSQFLGKLQLRRRVAGGIRQLAEQTAQSISKYVLQCSPLLCSTYALGPALALPMGANTSGGLTSCLDACSGSILHDTSQPAAVSDQVVNVNLDA